MIHRTYYLLLMRCGVPQPWLASRRPQKRSPLAQNGAPPDTGDQLLDSGGLGKWRTMRALAKGSSGYVYLCQDAGSSREAAVKFLQRGEELQGIEQVRRLCMERAGECVHGAEAEHSVACREWQTCEPARAVRTLSA